MVWWGGGELLENASGIGDFHFHMSSYRYPTLITVILEPYCVIEVSWLGVFSSNPYTSVSLSQSV